MSEPDANGWMPIETAPKDGTEILVFVDDRRNPQLRTCVACFETSRDGRSRWAVFATQDAIYYIFQPITHWQPLPKPPVSHSLPLTPEASTPAAITPPSVAAGTNSEAQP